MAGAGSAGQPAWPDGEQERRDWRPEKGQESQRRDGGQSKVLLGGKQMHHEWLDEYLLSFPCVEKDYQPVWQWFRYKVRGKMFATVCSPGPEHKTFGGHDLLNLKCRPAEGELLRAQYPDILPGFYSDKRTWISCLLDGDLPEEVLRDLCGQAYDLAVDSLPKYVQREIKGT